jgi:hypothetical protein
MLTIQYLEDSPTLHQLDPKRVVNKLFAATECVPITHLLIGWNVPPLILNACRKEADRLRIRFLRWQPLLTTDKGFQPDPAWQTEGLTGYKVSGYRGLPEFTFFCPNHPAVRAAVYEHLVKLIDEAIYQGFFLDRVRFPTPATNPIHDLACFCEHCQSKAAEYGLDLGQVRADLLSSAKEDKGCISLIKNMLSSQKDHMQCGQNQAIGQFLEFRKKCIWDFLAFITLPLRKSHLEVGLDCFSPSLAHMVGQDIQTMSELVDWIKLMTYAHTFAPAGIPFELSGLVQYLSTETHLGEGQALDLLAESIGLPLPNNNRSLEKDGLSTIALESEVRRGVETSSVPVLAGIEMVELEGVTNLKLDQIRSDLIGLKKTGVAGLAISWDLLHIPLERLDLVRQIYLGN